MSTTAIGSREATSGARVGKADMKLEVVVIPVSDVGRAAAAHGEHERRLGKADADWPDWYAAYLVAEQSGETPPE